ncbi:MAG: hypothetical protein AABX47_03485 [Nanoarchaeota archaeon]
MANASPLSRFIVLLAVIALISACNQQGTGTPVGTPFIGGQRGLEVSFEPNAPPAETFDGGSAPFDVVVRARNLGEYALPKEKVTVSVLGLNPEEFSMKSSDLIKNAPEELVPRRKDVQNNIVESNIVTTAFSGLNHKARITGTALTFPITAQVCYGYGTIAASQLCVRSDILNPRPGGLCELSGVKPVYNSGAPLQVENLVESPRAQNKIGFTFGIRQVDIEGRLFEKDSKCDTSVRGKEDKVFVDVKSLAGDIECQGLNGGTKSSNGFVQLYDKTKTITCTQAIGAPGDYTFPITIELTYDFQSSVSANLIVKHAETSSN